MRKRATLQGAAGEGRVVQPPRAAEHNGQKSEFPNEYVKSKILSSDIKNVYIIQMTS
jgi:hypothetical protein